MYENINFRKANMTFDGNYFYMIDDNWDELVQKLDDGHTAFSYPLSSLLTSAVTGLEYDGVNFWSMQNITGGVSIKQWEILNQICVLKNTYIFDLNFSSEAFTVEHYNTSLATSVSGSSNIIEVEGSYDSIISNGTLIHIGPNNDAEFEECVATSVSGSFITLNSGIINNYMSGDKVDFNTNLWIFNSYDSGSLCKYLLTDKQYIFNDHWAGDHVNKSGSWEYTIASNVFLPNGYYTATFDAYDNDSYAEIGLRIQSVAETTDIKAYSTGNNSWKSQSGNFCITGSGNYYDIKGRQLKNNTYIWGLDNVTIKNKPIVDDVIFIGHWAGDHVNKSGSWEYTIASNVSLDIGTYYANFDAYDADNSTEIALRIENVGGTIDVPASKVGNDLWVNEDGLFIITTSGNYDIKGRQLQLDTYRWGLDNVSIHKLNETLLLCYVNNEYDNITACTFCNVTGVLPYEVTALIYEKNTNLKYMNINTMGLYGTMVLDNFQPPATNIKIYDLAISGTNIYRLQKSARYYESNYSWTNYNYVLSTGRRFLDTVSISAYPVILPANAVNTTEITMLVDDQYGDGMYNKPVFFVDDDDVGFMTINPAYTDYFFGTGEAVSYYKAGVDVATVNIEGTATQYD